MICWGLNTRGTVRYRAGQMLQSPMRPDRGSLEKEFFLPSLRSCLHADQSLRLRTEYYD